MRKTSAGRSVAMWAVVWLCMGAAAGHAADQTWIDGNANNDWDTTQPNWDAGAAWINDNNAIFGGTGEVLDVNGSVSVVNVTFNVTGYDIGDAAADGTFTLSGTPSAIAVAAGSTGTISEVLAGTGGLTKEGDGILELTGAASPSTGNTIINAGTVQWGATDVLPAGTVTVADGATLHWTTTVRDGANKRSYTIRGTGVGGAGAVINNATSQANPSTMDPLYLAADATVSNSRRTDPYNTRLQGHRLTKRGQGNWNMRGSLDNVAGSAITVDEGFVQIEICNGAIQTIDGGIIVNPGAYFALLSYNGPTFSSNVRADIALNDGGLVGTSYNAQSGVPRVGYYGTVTVNGDCAIQTAWSGAAPVIDETVRDTQTDVYSEIGGSGNLTINPATMAMSGTISYPVVLHATNTLTGNISLEKGTLVLTTSGAATNCGQVTVSSGTTLVVSNTVNALGDTTQLIIADDTDNTTGVTLDTGVDDTIGGLLLGGVVQTTLGTYGSTSSGASIQNDEYFSGPGMVRLVAPPDQTWIDGNANNNWSLSDPNWDAGVAWLQNANAIFGGTGEAVELEDGVAVGDMTFNVDGYSIDDGDANGSLTLSGAPSVLTIAAGATSGISKPISGNGGLTKAGDGTLTLSGANSPSTGNTLVEAGILYWGANDALPSGAVTVQSDATVDLGSMTHVSQNARAYTITGTGTAGQGALIKTGAGSVMGSWGVNGLTLTADATIGGSSRFDIGGFVDFNGFVLTKLGNNSVPFRTTNLQDSGGGVVINQGHMYLENLDITIVGPVVVNSGGTLGTYVSPSGSRTFTLPITLNDGARLWAAGGAPVAGTSTFVGTIACSGTTYLYTGYSQSAGANPGDMIVDSTISGTGILIINDTATGRPGAADRTIQFNAANTFGGSMRIERGTLLLSASGDIDDCSSLDVASTATVEIQNTDGALSDAAALAIADDGDTGSGVTLASGVDETIGSLLLGGVLQTTIGTYGSSTSGANVQNDEYFSGDGVVRITGLPADMTWIDPNANNDWSTTEPNWDAGVGWLQNGSAIFGGTGEAVDLEDAIMVGNMTFNVDGYSIDDTDGDGGLTLSGAPSVVTVANAGDTSTVSKVIQGSGGLTKAGDGTLVLNGTNSTSTGGTIINAGKLQWGATDSLPSGSVTVNDGATLEWTTTVSSGANQRPITISGAGVGGNGAVLNSAQNHGANLFNSLTLADNATVGNARRMDIYNVDSAGFALTKVGVGNMNLRSLVGDTLQKLIVNEGLAQFEGVNATVPDGITVNSGAYMSVLANSTDRTLAADIALNGGGLVATWWNTSATNVTVSFLNPITVSGDSSLQIGINDPVVIDETNGQVDMDVMDSISGTGNLTINPGGGLSNPGGRLVRLLSDNTGLTGTLAIGGGNVHIDDAGSNVGSLNSGPLTVNGTLWLNRSDAQTIDDTVSGTGYTIIRYDGDVTFDGNTVGAGNIDVANGALRLVNGAAVTLSGNLTVATTARQTDDYSVSGAVNIPAGCSLSANGIVAGNDPGNPATSLAATINQSGGTVATSGDVGEGNGLRLAHYPAGNNVYNMSGGSLTIGSGYDLGLATDGTGWFNMTGGDVYAARVMLNERNNAGGNGILTLEGGTLHVGSGGITVDSPGPYRLDLGAAGGTVRATADFAQTVNATLYGSGANAAVFDSDGHTITVSGVLQGAGDLVKSEAGTMDITATCTYSGSTDVNAGTLRLSGSGALANSTDIEVKAGATLDIQNTSGALSDVGTLTVLNDSDSGTGVTLGAGVDETVYSIVLGGVVQTATGSYGSSASGADYPNDEYFSGDGVVRLPAGNHWDGTDTTADADGGNGAWDLTTSNWDDDATGGADVTWQNSPPTKAVFGGAAGTVEVDATVTVAGLTFDADGYAIADGDANGTLTLSGTPALTVGTAMDATISEQLTGSGGFVKTGTGGLFLSTDNTATLSGNVTVDAGTLYWGSTNALPLTPTVDDVITVMDGASVDFWSLPNLNGNSRRYAIAGTGVGGAGALVKTAGGGVGGNRTVGALNLLSDSSVGGTQRFDIYGLDMDGFKLTKEGNSGIAIRNPAANTDSGLTLNGGTVYFENFTQVMDGPVVVNSGTYLGLYPYSGGAQSFTADITLSGGRLFIGSNQAGSDGLWYGTIAVSGEGNILTGGAEAGKYIPGNNAPGDMHVYSTVSGAGDLYIMRASLSSAASSDREVCLYADNPFAGTVHIERGACRLLGSGTFLGATQIVVEAGVLLDIQNTGDTINNDGSLSIVNDMNSGTGVHLAGGVEELVDTLVLDGVTYGRGDGSFGSSASSANHKDDEFFTGTGIILLPEERGTLFIVK